MLQGARRLLDVAGDVMHKWDTAKDSGLLQYLEGQRKDHMPPRWGLCGKDLGDLCLSVAEQGLNNEGFTYQRLSARLLYLQYIRNRDSAVLH